jgi:hypothetical protein
MARRANIQRATRLDVIGLMSTNHYLGDVPKTSSFIYSCIEDERVVAAAAYGPCQAAKLPPGYLELKRLVSGDMKASLSSFLSGTLRLLRSEGVPAVLTWADPSAGHHGGIYQATNWIYAEPRSYCWNYSFRRPDGSTFDHRAAYAKYGTSSKKKVLEVDPNLEAFLPPMKLRYCMPLNITEDECLLALRALKKPYPKPRGNILSRPVHAQRSMA